MAQNRATVMVEVDASQLQSALRSYQSTSRQSDMLNRYGEAITKRLAARIIHCGVDKINSMIEDGRVSVCCEGTRIDVRSLARYIDTPDADHKARISRRTGKRRS